MKNREIKVIWKLAKIVWVSGFIFWAIETIIFLLIEGWHLKATSKIEIYCDSLVSSLWKNALFITIFCSINLLLNIKKK